MPRCDANREQEGAQCLGWIDRLLARSVRMQSKEDLPVGEASEELMSGVHGEGGLADSGHPVDCVDTNHVATACPGNSVHQASQFAISLECGKRPL